MNEILTPNAGLYADRHQLQLAEPLGSGKDGIVLAAKRKAQHHRFRKSIRIQAWGRNLIFFQTTVPRPDRLGLPAEDKA
jgi:hypothetical protein